MVAVRRPDRLSVDLEGLAEALEMLETRHLAASAPELEGRRDRLVSVIRNYLLTRLEEPEGPLLVVFAGPTGSGKSTLINSLAGIDLSATGAKRPTTGAPVFLTADPARITGSEKATVVVGAAPVLRYMTFVDTPDIDSTETTHRVTAEALVDRADVVVFVTSALRYGDEVPWEVLRRATSRGAAVINVLNRIDSGLSGAIGDFTRRLDAEGLHEPLIRVPEHHLSPEAARVPSLAVQELRRVLFAVVRERKKRQGQIVNRVVHSLAGQTRELLDMARANHMTAMEAAGENRARLASAAKAPVIDHAELEPCPRAWLPSRRSTRAWRQRARLVAWAETEALLRRNTLGTGVAASGLHGLAAEVVEGWLAEVDSAASEGSWRRNTALKAIGEALSSAHPTGEEAERARSALERRLAEAFDRIAGEISRYEGGLELEEVERRLELALASYQFADA